MRKIVYIGFLLMVSTLQVNAGDYVQRGVLVKSDIVVYPPSKSHFVVPYERVKPQKNDVGGQSIFTPVNNSDITPKLDIDGIAQGVTNLFNALTLDYFK